MSLGKVFERYELKFLLTQQQYKLIRKKIQDYFVNDNFAKSEICSLYCDTPNFLLARRSIEKPFYKEKLRIRSYGVAKDDSCVFVEIKKKYDSVVYKRRIATTESRALSYLNGDSDDCSQIGKEICYFAKFYEELQPRIFVSYSRLALRAKDDLTLRVTFDKNALWRDYDLSLSAGIYGLPILPKGKVLMEIKTATAIPMWLTQFLSENKIYKTSFSKYGTAYKQYVEYAKQGGKKIA